MRSKMSPEEASERLEEFRKRFMACYLFGLKVPTNLEDIKVVEAIEVAIAALKEKEDE